MSNKKEILKKDNVLQAIIIADTFDDEFIPISNNIPLALLPVVNKPIISYTLEFLSLGGVEETFLFCSSNVEAIKDYINHCISEAAGWSLTMKVNIIVSESCRSFGDCLRDIDAKGLLRGNFVLLEPGVISNIKLHPILKKHSEFLKTDNAAAMTLVFQNAGTGYHSIDGTIIGANEKNRLLYHKKLGPNSGRKIKLPLDMFLNNPEISLLHNLKDTRIAICSPSVLPLFSDNFDFQSKEDFVKGLLINEEISEGTIYYHVVEGNQYGGAVTDWKNYQAVSYDLKNRWIYPVLPPLQGTKYLRGNVAVGKNYTIANTAKIANSVIGENVIIGTNVEIKDSYIFSDTKIHNNVVIHLSVIGPNCSIKSGSKITVGSILGKGVIIEEDKLVENTLVQASRPEDYEEGDALGKYAYKLRIPYDETDLLDEVLSTKMSKLQINVTKEQSDEEDEDGFSDSEEDMSYTQSPAPDDTKLFFTEVIDSLTRGFEDQLQCDNLILEINSSRYAYNITVKEVNFHVVKAILHMSLMQPSGAQYFSHLQHLLLYFSPILKNYLRNESAMIDCLQAIEDVSTTNEELNDKWIMFVLKWFYDKDLVSEDSILKWAVTLDKNSAFYSRVRPFVNWLEEAEEEGSSESDDD